MKFGGSVGDNLKILFSKVFFSCCPGFSSDRSSDKERNIRTVPDSLSYDERDDNSVISLGEDSARWEKPCPSIPSVPNHLASVSSNRTMLVPLSQPVGAMVNMMAALRTAETEDSDGISSGFESNRCKSKPLNKKEENQEETVLAVLAKQTMDTRDERQRLKNKLACKKLQVKEDLKKVKRSKKRVQLEEALQAKWNEVDNVSQEEKAMATMERKIAMIQTLEREVEILKEKQSYKRMERNLVCTKERKGILSETIKLCKSTRIRHKQSALDKKIDNILTELKSLRDEVNNRASQKATTSTNVEDVSPQIVEQESVEYDFPKTNAALIALFLGESSRLQAQTDQEIMNLQEFMPESCEIPEQTSSEKEDCHDSIDSKSTYSFTFEQDVDNEDEAAADDQMAKSQPPLYCCTRLVSLHKLLPRPLEIIEEETQKDLEDYENGRFTCTFKFYPSCIEGDIRDVPVEDFYIVYP